MPLKIIRDDITKVKCDAIVNAANNELIAGGGVDGAIHRAAGPELQRECSGLGGCATGQAKITGAYRLPCRYVIHTVGPVWRGGTHGEKELLASCYRNSLLLAKDRSCESVAFPLISAGVYGYPKEQAIKVAMDEISAFLLENDMLVYIVVYGRESFEIGRKLTDDIEEYINENYVSEHPYDDRSRRFPPFNRRSAAGNVPFDLFETGAQQPYAQPGGPMSSGYAPGAVSAEEAADLEERLKVIDESFSQMLLRKIDEKGMKDSECYRKANVDRKLFSKIRGDVNYKPSKVTAVAFCIALELPLREAREMLRKAGFAFSPSSKFDIIVEFFIRKGDYNIMDINQALFSFDQPLIYG